MSVGNSSSVSESIGNATDNTYGTASPTGNPDITAVIPTQDFARPRPGHLPWALGAETSNTNALLLFPDGELNEHHVDNSTVLTQQSVSGTRQYDAILEESVDAFSSPEEGAPHRPEGRHGRLQALMGGTALANYSSEGGEGVGAGRIVGSEAEGFHSSSTNLSTAVVEDEVDATTLSDNDDANSIHQPPVQASFGSVSALTSSEGGAMLPYPQSQTEQRMITEASTTIQAVDYRKVSTKMSQQAVEASAFIERDVTKSPLTELQNSVADVQPRSEEDSEECFMISPPEELLEIVRNLNEAGGGRMGNSTTSLPPTVPTAEMLEQSVPIEEATAWSNYVSGMTMVDVTPVSQVYHLFGDTEVPDDQAQPETMIKVLSFFHCVGESSRRLERMAMQRCAQNMAYTMMRTQEELHEAGLANGLRAGGDDYLGGSGIEEVVCRGIRSVHVDSASRVVAELDVEPCAVSLCDVVAFHSAPLTQWEVVSFLKSVASKVNALHDGGFVHGALHGSNILCSTDNGRTVLTNPAGVASNRVYPPDMSSMSPSFAQYMRSSVERFWSEQPSAHPGRLGLPLPLDEGERLALHVLELVGDSDDGKTNPPFASKPSDDVYALGTLALFLLLGVPAFHGSTLPEVVETLCSILHRSHRGARGDVIESMFVSVLHCEYTRLRFQRASYSERFVACVVDFIRHCMASALYACGSEQCAQPPDEIYLTAGDALLHPLLSSYTCCDVTPPDWQVNEFVIDSEEERLLMTDTIHRVAYPVYTTKLFAQKQCGTSPCLSRLFCNSLFSARWGALRQAMAMPESMRGADVVTIQWPYLRQRATGWGVAVPSVTSCSQCRVDSYAVDSECPLPSKGVQSALVWRAITRQNQELMRVCELYFPLCSMTQCLDVRLGAARLRKKRQCMALAQHEHIEIQMGGSVLPMCHTLLFEHKNGALLSLSREDFCHLHSTIDTLVLRHLKGCRVEILTHFRYVVLDDVRECEVLLGPCVVCCLIDVHDCSTIAVASSYLLMEKVSHVSLHYLGSAPPMDGDGTVEFVNRDPYTVVYTGLSEDFAAVGLVQEHNATLLALQDGLFSANRRLDPPQLLFRAAQVCVPGRQGHDFPYSHSLGAFGNRFLHCDDNESDVYVYFNELRGKDVYISNIHGGESPLDAAVGGVDDLVLTSQMQGTEEVDVTSNTFAGRKHSLRCPVIFVLDQVGDVVIQDCTNCTIFVVGAKGGVCIRQCQSVRILFMARESMVVDCADVELFAFVTESFTFVSSLHVEVYPLFLQCPYVDSVLSFIVDATGEGGQPLDELFAAYDARDVETLNIVLQGGSRRVEIQDCEDVLVHDSTFYADGSGNIPFMISVDAPVMELSSSRSCSESSGTVGLSSCNFFAEWCAAAGMDIESDFRHITFGECVMDLVEEGNENGASPRIVPLVRLHDMLDNSILRLPHSFHLRSPETVTGHGGPQGSPLGSLSLRTAVSGDLVLDRLSVGEVHIADAVGKLWLLNCRGPLDVIVCVAQRVIMCDCQGVVLRTACKVFEAHDCHGCHIALHVNTPPRFSCCSQMLVSVLNITTLGMEHLLESADVDVGVNYFAEPEIRHPASSLGLSGRGEADEGGGNLCPSGTHRYCCGLDCQQGVENDPCESLEGAFRYLRWTVRVVAPLKAVCVGISEAPFLGPLEDRVREEVRRRIPVEVHFMDALSFIAKAKLDALVENETAAGTGDHTLPAGDGPMHSCLHKPNTDGLERPTSAVGADEKLASDAALTASSGPLDIQQSVEGACPATVHLTVGVELRPHVSDDSFADILRVDGSVGGAIAEGTPLGPHVPQEKLSEDERSQETPMRNDATAVFVSVLGAPEATMWPFVLEDTHPTTTDGLPRHIHQQGIRDSPLVDGISSRTPPADDNISSCVLQITHMLPSLPSPLLHVDARDGAGAPEGVSDEGGKTDPDIITGPRLLDDTVKISCCAEESAQLAATNPPLKRMLPPPTPEKVGGSEVANFSASVPECGPPHKPTFLDDEGGPSSPHINPQGVSPPLHLDAACRYSAFSASTCDYPFEAPSGGAVDGDGFRGSYTWCGASPEKDEGDATRLSIADGSASQRKMASPDDAQQEVHSDPMSSDQRVAVHEEGGFPWPTGAGRPPDVSKTEGETFPSPSTQESLALGSRTDRSTSVTPATFGTLGKISVEECEAAVSEMDTQCRKEEPCRAPTPEAAAGSSSPQARFVNVDPSCLHGEDLFSALESARERYTSRVRMHGDAKRLGMRIAAALVKLADL